MTSAMTEFDEKTQRNLNLWLTEDFDSKTKDQIRELLRDNPKEIADAFYTTLSFGTGGLRGIVGPGSNRMNIYTVRGATQGLANYLNSIYKDKEKPSVIIGFDSRLESRQFAEETAKVLAANHITAYLMNELRPVAMVSFGCRWKKCQAGVMITASHNPPFYNGYKVFWEDGAQVLPPHDKGIIQEVNKIQDLSKIKTTAIKDPNIVPVGRELDEAYLKAIASLQTYPEEDRAKSSELKLVYTNLHGTGITMVPKALDQWGFKDIFYVEKQKDPDGHFPTVASANPEIHATLKLGIETLTEVNGDLLLATDPDADRVGVVVNHKGGIVFLTGNQIGCLCLEHICEALTSTNRLPPKPAVIKSIVTSELFKAIAESYHISCFDVLTGFKYFGQKIHEWEEKHDGYQFIFGAEESYGFLYGTHARDKDAIIACALISEVALHNKLQGKTLVDKLNEIYKKYGVYREKLLSVDFEESKAGHDQMNAAMQRMRSQAPKSILGTPIICIEDYLAGKKTFMGNGRSGSEQLDFPKSNVLSFHFADQTKLIVRPSGTEPKIKLYCGTTNKGKYGVDEAIEHCDVLADEFLKAMKLLLT